MVDCHRLTTGVIAVVFYVSFTALRRALQLTRVVASTSRIYVASTQSMAGKSCADERPASGN